MEKLVTSNFRLGMFLDGAGMDATRRIVAPMIGGSLSAAAITLIVLPVFTAFGDSISILKSNCKKVRGRHEEKSKVVSNGDGKAYLSLWS